MFMDQREHSLKNLFASLFLTRAIALSSSPKETALAMRRVISCLRRENLHIANAPLYPTFLAAHQGRGTGTRSGLNNALRLMAPELNSALPTHP